uniref:Laminin subunit alpha-2 n=1 Tax=Haemonchus contortus TaxID=6289 RepID=A0A7I4XW57_HAECO
MPQLLAAILDAKSIASLSNTCCCGKTAAGGSPQCDICDANDARHRHPIEFAIDGTRRWWQSPSLANGLEYEKVNVTIDLRQEYQVAYVVVKMGNAPRPGTWVLEKSLDGIHYEPWQYFATSDAECMRQFGVPATTGVPRFERDDEVHCTSEYSKITPLEGGEIHTSLVNGRPGVEKPSVELQKFTRARFVRLRLISPRTLNADLMIINRQTHRIDRSVTMRYYYSISDISIGGQCICYGHAESCPSDPVTGQFKCECRHNTCGESCNRCCPLFNQLQWKPGTNAHPNACQQCQCFNHADSCVYDEELDHNKWSITPEGVYEGGGRCVDCKHNTEGFNCERCKDGYYRPSGLSHYREDACRTCDCDLTGSVSDVCIRDDQSALSGQHPGDCVCKPGFGGRRCERCARGYRNYPKCEPCPCNQAGSVNFDTCEEEKCQCKANVEGLYCDRCRPNTIHLSADNPQGCQACFCFGMTDKCREIPWVTASISNNVGWNLTDLSGGRDVRPEVENREVLMFNANQNKDRSLFYWKAPDTFTGNMLNSYGGNLQFYVYYVPLEQGNSIPVADLVIEGNGIKVEYYSRMDFFPRENMTVQIPIREGSGWYNSVTRTPAEKVDMLRALAGVERFMVRAMYQQNQLQSSIFGLTLDTAVPPPEGSPVDKIEDVLHPSMADTRMRGVEVCQCPENFAGNSCESCVPGYRRVNNQLYGGHCEKCTCQDHSDTCDPFTGACTNCQHNTTGPRCELCLPGHYGNPSLGGELGACRPCACPTAENSRSAECVMTQLVVSGPAASQEDAYVCTACERGYEGNKCEVCADGFFGNPMEANGTCKECECNGNIDLMAIGNCDTVTGRCLKCIGDTTGEHCEICKENHWGSALEHTCKPCGCHHVGASSPQCGNLGECTCKPNYIGKQCDRCVDGHGDIENGCPPCECDVVGSIGDQCDAVSGQCTCKQGVFGKRCNQCRPSYFNFTDAGCQFCHCNIYGSIQDGKCNNITGKCECRDNVDGTMCEKCADGFFNITSGVGCQACECDLTGSDGEACDLHSGQCVCKPGVTGLKCDRCQPNHYGLSAEGCKECRACPAPGQVCDPVTGECVCPPNTVGEMCENCTENAWDYHPLKGCKLCECSDVGSSDGKCDTRTGQCKCRNEYVGLRCDRCTHGFFGFPNCQPCDCQPDGTDPLQCKDGLCLCNEEGECPCKKNVMGAKCDQCKESTFSLEASNPLGCTDCFCFNRSSSCEQSPLLWQQTYAEDRRAVFEEPWEYYTKKHNLNLLKEYPARYNSYPTDAVPLYWPLPKSMLGDRTSSYNGFLRFKIWNEDNRRGIDGVRPDTQYFRYFPQVVLVGNNRIELEHIPLQIEEDGKYKVRLHESEWRSRQSPELPVTRKLMMIALQNLQGVYIRGTYNYPARGDAITMSEVSLDVAVPASPGLSGSTAIGVEQCTDCPQGFTGSSCQNPAVGYCRKRQRDYLNSPDDMSLIGWSEPCACNGHSTTCHPETCVCTDCEHNTTGDHCDLCKSGYIGDAREGGANACTKCACPLVENSFSDTCVAVDYGRGYVCNACKAGYTGQYCESCVIGYFGEPSTPGGFCQSCDCHPDGSLNGACNPLTGQCECREGVTGRDCSRCQHRHAFIGGVCTSCDQGCYLPLMTMIDDLEMTLANQNFSNLRPIPWKRLFRIENNTELIFDFMKGLDGGGESEVDAIVMESKYAKEALAVVDGARFQDERIAKGVTSLEQFTALAENLILDAQATYANAFNTTQFLKHFHEHGGTTVGGATLDAWLRESEAHYNATLERGKYIEKRLNRAEQEHKKNEELLKKVFANKLNDTSFENLQERLDEFDQWLEDYRATIYDSARRDTAEAERMSNVVAKRIDRYKEVSNEIEKLRAEAEDDLAAARNAVDSAKGKELLNMFDDSRAMNETLKTAADASSECRNISMMYAQLIDEYDEVFVQKAAAHAERLERAAEVLKDSFKDTKLEAENPLKASHAYEQIASGLKNATKASNDALTAAEGAYAEADGDSENSLLKRVGESKGKSETLAKEAAAQRRNWEDSGMEKERQAIDERLSAVNEQNIDMTKRSDAIKNQWSKFDDHHDRTIGLQSVARDADQRAKLARESTDVFVKDAKEVADRMSKLLNSTGKGIREEIEKVRQARVELEKNRKALEEVGGISAENRNRADEMQKQLAILKDKINEAREKAQQIRVSLRSDERGICQRSFISPAHPSPSNSFSIRYRPLRNVPDSTIFVTRTKPRRTQPSEFIAIEIRGKRVVAHWNIGGGARMATNSHSILFIPNTDRANWYHIDVERIGNALNLTVALKETLTGASPRHRTDAISVFVGGGEWDGDVVFNTIPGETQISMGTDVASAEEMGLATNKFYGVIGSLMVDGILVPLWAFSSNSPECDGATSPPQPTVRGYMFRDGFAQIEMATFERTVSSVSVVFNAYSPEGLLYFRGSETSGDFFVLYLKDGHVIFKIHLGGQSHAELKSKHNYADGREHTVKAIRSGNEIHLQVDSDADRFSTTIPGENTALNIESDWHYVAGVPASLKTELFDPDIKWKHFFGCILSVKPTQTSDLDLDHPVRWLRREPGCHFSAAKLVPTDRIVGFSRPGFLLQKGVIMDNNSSFAFGFRTKEENGTLIFQSSKLSAFRRRQRDSDGMANGKGYMAFYLFRGYLVLHFGKDASSRKGVVTIRSNHMYNDGRLHSVFMSRKGKIVQLRVDDKEVGEKQVLDDESPIGSATSQMFIGGFAERSKPPNNEIPTTVPLIGCVSDMYHNYKKVPIVPEEHSADIGSCAIESKNFATPIDEPLDPENYKHHRKDSRLSHQLDRNFYDTEKSPIPVAVKPTKGEVQTCGGGFASAERDGMGAVRFGISKTSHSRVNFEGKLYPNISDFQISFSIRTEQPTGMIWVWANYKNYTRYFYFNIIDGYPTIEVKGRHPEPKILKNEDRRLDDGHWHDIVIVKKGRELLLMADELLPVSIKDCPTPKVMRRRMYIGGVISKHRSAFGPQTPGFDGCIRDLKVNDVLQSLEGGSSRDVIPCSQPTKGMYAHEGGFAVFEGLQKSIKDGSRNIDMRLSFRPIVDEGTVLALLTNSNPDAARLTIEIKQDKVLVTVIHEESGLEILDAIPTLRPLCDGGWHSLHLFVGDNIMQITIDDERNELPIDQLSSAARDLFLNLPVNIAGVSAPVAEKLSMTSLTGCYRQLRFSGHPKYFEKALKQNKVALDSCPFR